MTRFCAFLRGVNVKGTNMKMVDVCKVFSEAKMQNVVSVLASGNIIFSSEKSKEELKPILEKALSDYFDYEAFLFVKTIDEIDTYWNDNPFSKDENFHVYAFIGIDEIENILLSEFDKGAKTNNEEVKIINHQFYWKVEKGNTLDSDFGKILSKKSLKDKFTSRNINTFEKILKK